MNKYTLILLFCSWLGHHAACQDLSVQLKAQILATIMQGKINRTAKWERSLAPDEPGALAFNIAWPRSIMMDKAEVTFHLDMGQKLFLSFFNSQELQGLRTYRVTMTNAPNDDDKIYDLPLEANFHDIQESEYLRLDCLTRAIPYLAWSNYLSISHKAREQGVILTLKDNEKMTPGNACEDFCNVIALAVYYYAFRQHLNKPLRINYRSGDQTRVFEYQNPNDFHKALTLFAQR